MRLHRSLSSLSSRRLPAGWLAIGLLFAFVAVTWADPDDPPINYSKMPGHDQVAQLEEHLEHGQAKLRFDANHDGYLPSLLKALKIPQSSQMLVFSKTSFQRNLISPRHPRAIYFNDDTYVGYVHNGTVLEIASMDPQQGTMYYTLPQAEMRVPKITRQISDCTQCHQSGSTKDVPGLLMRSIYPEDDGMPAFSAGTYTTTDQSPFSERWGGWYVSGTHGRMRHMGNVTIDDDDHPDKLDTNFGANVTDLSHHFKPAAYLQPTSDIVALMVVTHQVNLHNLLTQASYDVRSALYEQHAINEALKEKPDYESEGTQHRIMSACDPVVEAMLFSGETPIVDPIAGNSTFAKDFTARGPRDAKGRSLRDFDLQHRIFKYPCSYLIYSDQFDALPAEAKKYIYRRLWNVLNGKDKEQDAKFSNLSAEDRQSILQIILATKKGLPDYWKMP